MLRPLYRTVAVLSLGLLLSVAGCRREAPRTDAPAGKEGEHAHKPGAHGGQIVSIGRDNYHAEVVFADKGAVEVFMLDHDESKVLEVERQKLTAYARPAEGTQSIAFVLEPSPQPNDGKGKTSRFASVLPADLWGQRVDVTVQDVRIGDGRFRFAFRNYRPGQHGTSMPAGVASEKAKKLYFTPGGKYTAADIKANGPLTARQKYRDEMPEHDAHPKKGERICPISKTKANPKFAWVIGGETYTFCCTPCIDELVKKARERPDEVWPATDYVKKD